MTPREQPVGAYQRFPFVPLRQHPSVRFLFLGGVTIAGVVATVILAFWIAGYLTRESAILTITATFGLSGALGMGLVGAFRGSAEIGTTELTVRSPTSKAVLPWADIRSVMVRRVSETLAGSSLSTRISRSSSYLVVEVELVRGLRSSPLFGPAGTRSVGIPSGMTTLHLYLEEPEAFVTAARRYVRQPAA
jgi:hypothetical protein